MSSFAKISIRFNADLKQFRTELDNASKAIEKAGKQMNRVGKKMTVGLTAPLTALGVLSTKTFADFEQELAKVEAVSGATSDQMQALRKNAEDLGASTRFAASQVAELQLNFSKLGLSPEEILAATEATLNLALATGEDLASSATVAASTVRGFGLAVDETTRVTDVMAASFSASALDLNKFSTAMATVAPVANVAGQSIEEATGMLSVLVNAGIDASSAGTGLRNIFLEISKSGMTLDEALGAINNSTNKNATSMELFGKLGATVATVLAGNIDEARDLTKAYEGSAGAAARMARTMDNTLQGSLLALKSAIESAAIAIGQELAPVIRSLVDRLAGIISRFKDLDSSTKKIIVVVGALVAAIGPLLVSLGFLMTTVIPGLITAFAALRAAMLATPFGMIAAGVGIAVAAFAAFNREGRAARETQSALIQVSKSATAAIAEEKAKVEELLWAARDEQLSKEHRLAAIRELNKISPEYLGNLDLETINTKKAREEIERYNTALIASAKAKAAQEKMREIQAKIIEKELEMSRRRRAIAEEEADILSGAADNASAAAASEQRLAFAKKLVNSETQTSISALQEEAAMLMKIIRLSDIAGKTPPNNENKNEYGGFSRNTLFDYNVNDEGGFSASNNAFLQGISMPSPYRGLEIEMRGQQASIYKMADGMSEKMGALAEAGQMASYSLSSTFQNFSNNFIDSLGLASHGIQGFAKSLTETITKIVSMMLAQSISQAIAGATASGLSSGPAAAFTTPAFISTAISGVLAAFAAIPKFADGGIVNGPMLAMVGEYSNAKTNPEVIAPLNKLKGLIGRSISESLNQQMAILNYSARTDLPMLASETMYNRTTSPLDKLVKTIVDNDSRSTVQRVEVTGVLKGVDMHLQNKRTASYLNRRS